ncbi:MAG: LuxR family transcriptional regulator [Microbacterium sp.]|nr:LuxR family transcriptional regulator [Microbacterium sp.]
MEGRGGIRLSSHREAIDRLTAARDTGGWKDVLRVLTEHWDSLYRDHPAELLRTLDAMSEDVLDRDPRLRLGRRDLRRAQDARAEAEIPPVPRGGKPVERLAALTDQIAAARSMGRLAVAVDTADTAVTYFHSLPIEVLPALSRSLPAFLYQWGATYVQAGRFSDALHQFAEGVEVSRSVDNRMMMTACGGGAALVHALHGRAREAETFLQELPPLRGDEWWAAPAPGLLADAWLQVDRLDYAAAAERIARVDIARSPAYWVAYFVIRTYLAAAGQESRQALLAEFDTFIESLPAGGVASPVHAEAISIVRYLLLLHLRRPGQALRELDPEPVTSQADVFTQLAATIYASHLLTLGRRDQARRLVFPLLDVPNSRPRILIRALLIAAEVDTLEQNEEFLRRATELAHWHSHYSPFILSPPPTRQRAAELLEESGDPDMAERIRALPERRFEPTINALTPKETAVVELAVSGLTNAEMANRLHISTNTVKSHLRSAYAKLGVSNRRQLAERLGSAR